MVKKRKIILPENKDSIMHLNTHKNWERRKLKIYIVV